MIRGLSVLLALRGAAAAGDVPSCATEGMAYSQDRDSATTLPNGAYLATSTACQQSCTLKADCTHFTWRKDSIPGGACYLFTKLGKETPDENAISGPKECIGANTAAVTVPTVPPLPGVVTIAPAIAKAATAEAGKVTDEVLGATPEVTTEGNGGNGMVYGLLGGVAGVVAVAGGAYYFMSGGDKKKKKSKRAVGVEQAPMIEEAPAPAAPTPAAPALPAGYGQYPMYPVAQPMAQQAQMTPVPQFYYNQVPAYQPAMYSYQ